MIHKTEQRKGIMDKVLNHGDIIDDMIRLRLYANVKNKTVFRKVIADYIRIVKDNVLNGYAFDFGRSYKATRKLGTLCIYKRKNDERFVRVASGTYRDLQAKSNIGYNFVIRLEGDMLKKFHMVFKPSKSFKMELHRKIVSGFNEYRMLA